MLNQTHDPQLRSWVEAANRPDADFPIQNLPFAVFRRAGAGESFRCGVAIGDQVLDLRAMVELSVLARLAPEMKAACAAADLASLMTLGRASWSSLRAELSALLHADRSGSSAERT